MIHIRSAESWATPETIRDCSQYDPVSAGPSQIITEMNRFVSSDSKLSLDEVVNFSDSAEMISQPYHLYVERSDASRNMARYYAMSIEPNLFGDICLLRKWGRIGTKGQVMVHHFGREEDAVRLFLDLLREKRKRGYRPRTPISK